MEPVNPAIIYYSATGTVHALAQAAAEGAEKAGAQVRLRKVADPLRQPSRPAHTSVRISRSGLWSLVNDCRHLL
jgi:hypothetical protein